MLRFHHNNPHSTFEKYGLVQFFITYWGVRYQLVFNLSSRISCRAIIQDLSPFICHLNVRSQDTLWFSLPCKTAVWLQEIWIIKRTTRRLSLRAQQGIQTPQTKNMGLNYEERMRVVSLTKMSSFFFLCCWETCSQWRFEKHLKRRSRRGLCVEFKNLEKGQLKDGADVSACFSPFAALHRLTADCCQGYIMFRFFFMTFQGYWSPFSSV